jgi:outer membrane murein-binding lipoprotein Lpp
MISFRFHVVSITAVFLAIAIGVVVGTTYVDRAVVDNLETRIDRVSKNLDTRKAQNDALEHDLNDVRAYVDASGDYAVTDRLTDVPVVILALRGVDEDAVKRTAQLARRAGARTPGVVWIESKWGLRSDGDRAALATAIGAAPTTAASALRGHGVTALVGALASPSPPGATPQAPDQLLTALVSGGFLSVDALGDSSSTLTDLAAAAPRVLVVTGSEARKELSSIVSLLTSQTTTSGLPTVVADVYAQQTDGPARSKDLTAAVADAVRGRIILVDDADEASGRVAAVLGLDVVAKGTTGHFGYGSGANGVLPGWTPP